MEQLAEELLHHRRFDHGSLDMLLSVMVATRPQPHRGLWTDAKQSSFVMSFGFYVHGPMSGITKATIEYPKVCRYVNGCVARWFPHMSLRQLHLHLWSVQNGALWMELREEDPDLGLPLVWKEKPNGARVPGVSVSTRHAPLQISPKRYHSSQSWTGDRYVVTAFTPRSGDATPKEDVNVLRRYGFGLPRQSLLTGVVENQAFQPEEDAAIQVENALTVEDYENILHPLKEAVDALEEIQTVYPPVAKLDVAMLCDPWMSGDTCEVDFEQGGLSYAILGFKAKCDFGSHRGYRTAQEQLALLQPRWVVCNVPRGPESVKMAVGLGDKESAKMKKCESGSPSASPFPSSTGELSGSGVVDASFLKGLEAAGGSWIFGAGK